jgi:hypothetical protein
MCVSNVAIKLSQFLHSDNISVRSFIGLPYVFHFNPLGISSGQTDEHETNRWF